MPNAIVLEQKKAIVSELADKMKNAAAGVFVSYKGINVADDTTLRRELRDAGVEYSVIKNTLARFAIKEIGFDAIDEHLHGSTSLAISMEDPIAPARILCAYAKKNPEFQVKIGFMEGNVMAANEVTAIAELPSRETLVAQVLYGFNTPITKLALALDAICQKTEDTETLVSTLVAPATAEATAE